MELSTIEQELLDYFADLDEPAQTKVLTMVKTLAASQHLGGVSIEEYNQEIDEALADVEAGNYITQEELEKISAEWHKRKDM
jgi:predicted transcriptional regulator